MDLPANGGPPGKAVRIIDSSVPDFAPQFSPDGTRLAFVSARSGNMEIWTSDTRGSNLFQVTALRSYASVPRWSPDGTRLAFNASIEGNSDIFTVNADGGGLKRVTFEPSWEARPSWSHDGRWLYFRSNRSGSDQIWKAPPEGGEAVQITRSGGMEAFEAPDGGTLFYAKSWAADGIWTVPVQGGPETLAIGGIMPNFWGVANRGVFYLDFGASSEGSVPLMLLSFETRESLPIAVIEKVQPSNDPGFTVTGDGRRIAWAQNDRVEAKLMLVEGFR
jgi:Tol biopolymer transport system component